MTGTLEQLTALGILLTIALAFRWRFVVVDREGFETFAGWMQDGKHPMTLSDDEREECVRLARNKQLLSDCDLVVHGLIGAILWVLSQSIWQWIVS